MKKFTDIKNNKRINESSEFIDQILNDNPIDDGEIAGTVESNECSKLFSKLFESREMAHIYHLQVRGDNDSYSKHIALEFYYENSVSIIDDLIETYQGQYGLVEGYDIIDTKETKTKDTISYFEEVCDFIKHSRTCISDEDSHLHSIIDDIVCLLYKTLYKLKFTK